MPFLDLSDMAYDPDFASAFTVLRRTQVIDPTTGSATITSYPIVVTGMVRPVRASTLVRAPDLSRAEASVELTTATRLMSLTTTNVPDMLLYQGKHYIVTNLQDFGAFGSGLFVAVCTLTDLAVGSTVDAPADPLAPTLGNTFILGQGTLAS